MVNRPVLDLVHLSIAGLVTRTGEVGKVRHTLTVSRRRRPLPDNPLFESNPSTDMTESLVQKNMVSFEAQATPELTPERSLTSAKTRRPTTVACTWCGSQTTVLPVGRVPSWCSNSCRHRAWEQRRAASSGLASREQVERLVEIEVPVTIIKEVEVAVLPKGASWAKALTQLADQLDRGLVYDRDLADLAQAIDAATEALARRPWWRNRRVTR